MERFRILMEQIEQAISELSQDTQELENKPTKEKLDAMRKDVQNVRGKVSNFATYLNNFRVW